jgi:hypothetical protein
VASTTAEAVRHAGGWLVDRVLAGWGATVLTTDRGAALPIRILGARADDLECALGSLPRWPPAQAVAVDAALYRTDPRVRRMVDVTVAAGSADLRLWGERCLVDPDCSAGVVRHHLSVAARAFKAQALIAASAWVDEVDGVHGVGPVEAFDVSGLAGHVGGDAWDVTPLAAHGAVGDG